MNTAMPSAIGVAIASARTDEYSVPQMNGSAPNSPDTGSQISVRQKLRPNFWIDSIDCATSTAPIAQTMSTRTSANAPVPIRNPRSFPTCLTRRTRPTRLRDLDLRERRHFQFHNRVRQRCISEIRAVLLTIGQRPLHELHHRLCLRLVLRRFVQQQPRERRDGVDAF